MYKITTEDGEIYSKTRSFNEATKHFKECWKIYSGAYCNSSAVTEVALYELRKE